MTSCGLATAGHELVQGKEPRLKDSFVWRKRLRGCLHAGEIDAAHSSKPALVDDRTCGLLRRKRGLPGSA
jgi:hypothetical protein